MAFNFSANQFEQAYRPKGLNNWELAKWYPPRPRSRKGSTKVIANDRGHLLDCSKKSDKNPWGNFCNTYQLPDKLSRNFSEEYNQCLLKKDKWRSNFPKESNVCEDNLGISGKSLSCPTKCEATERILSFDKNRKKYFDSSSDKKKNSKPCCTCRPCHEIFKNMA